MPTLNANGIKIYYEIKGKGEPLVLIGGLSTDLTAFETIADDLSGKFMVLSFDNRGAGRTDMPDEPYSIEMMAEDTSKLMETLGIESANIVGISMGGRIALEMALNHSEKVEKLILVSTAAAIRSSKANKLKFIKTMSKLIVRKKYPQPGYAFMRQLEASRSYDCVDRLGEIKAPAFILHGKRDRMAPYELAQELHGGIKGSKMKTFKGGHLFFLWERKEFADEVTGFLTDSGSAGTMGEKSL